MRVAYFRICLVLLLMLMAAACVGSLRLSTHGFSGYDVSPMIDAGWRVISGQVPGRDFIATFPPSLYLATAASFGLFGVTWRAIALGDCLLYLALCLHGLRLASFLKAKFGTDGALLAGAGYVGAQTILLISINYLWHSALAESFALYAVLATAALISTDKSSTARRLEIVAGLVAAIACLLLSKPNTAFLSVLLCVFVLARASVSRRLIGGVLAGALLLASLMLASAGTNLLHMLGGYAGLTGRLIPKAFVNGILFTLYARYGLANLLVYAVLGFTGAGAIRAAVREWREGRSTPIDLLGMGSIAVAVVGMGTNFDFKLTDAPLFLAGLLLLSLRSPGFRRMSAVGVVSLVLLAGYFGVTRFRMQIVGTWADDKCGAKKVWDDVFLGHFVACAIVPDTLDEVDAALASVPKGSHVFFGPAMEFLYARERIQSPAHLPNWWDPGSSFPLARENEVSRAWEGDRFDLLIFAHGNQAQIPEQILADIRSGYVLLPGGTMIDVYVPRGARRL